MTTVLVVDDSPVARRFFVRILESAPDLLVVGEAGDAFAARDLIVDLSPDVILLDIEMPKMDGITFLRRLMHYHPMPVVICSSLTTGAGEAALAAMAAGAVDVISKPNDNYTAAQLEMDLIAAVRGAAVSRRTESSSALHRESTFKKQSEFELVAIGASTGGTVAVERILRGLPTGMPPMLIVQHMPPYITKPFAERLRQVTRFDVQEARDGQVLRADHALVAPGGQHLALDRQGSNWIARVRNGPRVNGHRPSVDVLFQSIAQRGASRAIGILLTGMGGDGAEGLLAMRQAGAHTLVQDEATSVVFGMPAVAISLGAAAEVVGLPEMPARLVRALERPVSSLRPLTPQRI